MTQNSTENYVCLSILHIHNPASQSMSLSALGNTLLPDVEYPSSVDFCQ